MRRFNNFKAPLSAAIVLVMVLCFSLPLFAEGVEETEFGIQVEDALGRTVSLTHVPSRIVIAGRAAIMLTDALYLFEGVGERLVAVGVTDQGIGDFLPVLDPDRDGKTRLGKSAGPEEILAQRPDLVILKSYMRDSLGTPIEISGVPVLYLDLETPEQYNRDLRILGTVLDQQSRAEELIGLFASREEAIREAVAGVERKSVALFQFNTKGGNYTFSVSPRGWIQETQVRLAGGEPVWLGSALSPGWNQVAFEQIARWNPAVIVFVAYRSDAPEAIERVQADPLWQQLAAVRNGALYAMPADYYSWGQPDSRWILGADWLARALHPDRFETPFSDSVMSFFKDFYMIDSERYEQEILPRLAGDLF